MNNNKFMDFFNGIVNDPKNQPDNISNGKNSYNCSSTTDIQEELDYLWNEYQSYLTQVKEQGYKVMRNENGKHRLEKR